MAGREVARSAESGVVKAGVPASHDNACPRPIIFINHRKRAVMVCRDLQRQEKQISAQA